MERPDKNTNSNDHSNVNIKIQQRKRTKGEERGDTSQTVEKERCVDLCPGIYSSRRRRSQLCAYRTVSRDHRLEKVSWESMLGRSMSRLSIVRHFLSIWMIAERRAALRTKGVYRKKEFRHRSVRSIHASPSPGSRGSLKDSE